MEQVVLFGTGGGADTARRYLESTKSHRIVAYTVDRAERDIEVHRGLPVVDFEDLQVKFPPQDYRLFILLGFQEMNSLRIKKYVEGKEMGYRFASYISPDIFAIEPICCGENCFILDKQTINLDVTIGNNVVMWSGNHVGDRSKIGDGSWLSSQVAIGGDSVVGAGTFVGMHATISHSVKVGARNFIGAGALITADTKDDQVFVEKSTRPGLISSLEFSRII